MKKLISPVLALILFAAITALMVASAGAQDVTTWATPVPEAPGASGLAALIVAILVAIILVILAGR